MRLDERMLEKRSAGTAAVHRHIRPPEQRVVQALGTGQPVAPTTGSPSDRRPPEHPEDALRRTAGHRQLLAARSTGRLRRRRVRGAVARVLNSTPTCS